MVENCYRHLSEMPPEERAEKRLEVIITSAKQVGRAIFFSLAIIILSFVPVFLLEGQEGKLFHPLAFTKTFSMMGSAMIAITLVPVLMYFFMRGKMPPESANPVSSFFIRLYSPVIRWVLKWKKTTILLNVIALAVAIPMFMSIGSEFMPPLDEGSLLYMPVTLPNVSISEAKRLIQVQDKIIKSVPEVEHVLGKVGRAETSTDPAPVSMFESIIILKDKDKWRPGITKADIVSELDGKLQQIGVRNGWTQPIINRINMLSTGVRTDLGVKIFGNDLNVLKDLAVQAEGILKTVPGAADVVAETGHRRQLHRHRHRPGGGGPLRRQGWRHPGRHQHSPGGGDALHLRGRKKPLPDPPPLHARLPGQHPGYPADSDLRHERRDAGAGAAVAGHQAQSLHRRAGDQQ